MNITGHAPRTQAPLPSVPVLKERIRIQDHHYAAMNRYIWTSSDLTHNYVQVCTDCNNTCAETDKEVDSNNSRP